MKRELKFRVYHKAKKVFIIFNAYDGYPMEFKDRVDENTIGQYTGLKDKDGKEIYEGDIRLVSGQDNWYIQVIEFHNTSETCGRGWIGRNLWKSNREGELIEKIKRFSYFGMPQGGEIIGNKFEHPNLI
ncbi:MAG: hypothetical protein IIC76_14950 [Bacteroidetes bacterium]|nr:hypothetical protein [Bacteroidota bacterium]